MKKNNFDLNAYLQRLNYSGEIVPTIDRLEALHRAQIYTIPFENFDILLGRGISLDPERLFDKLVNKDRGGYCFELNGLFLRVLKAIGFNARALLPCGDLIIFTRFNHLDIFSLMVVITKVV